MLDIWYKKKKTSWHRKGKYRYIKFRGTTVCRVRDGKHISTTQSLLTNGNWQIPCKVKPTDIRVLVELLELDDIEAVIRATEVNEFTEAERVLMLLRGYPCSEGKGTT